MIDSVGDEDIILFVYKDAMGAALDEYAVAPRGEMVTVRVIDIEEFIATRIDEDAVLRVAGDGGDPTLVVLGLKAGPVGVVVVGVVSLA